MAIRGSRPPFILDFAGHHIAWLIAVTPFNWPRRILSVIGMSGVQHTATVAAAPTDADGDTDGRYLGVILDGQAERRSRKLLRCYWR